MPTYINPLTDFGFKRIFGNREILMSFLNDLLPIEHKIVDITFKNIEKLGATEDDRKAIFDLSCTDERGDEFIVELQRAKQAHFQDRALYYTTFPIQEQARRGSWDFKLTNIFFIGILDFKVTAFDDENYIHHGQITDINSKKVMNTSLNFIYIELTKFKKERQELANHLEKWIYILSNLSSLDNIPEEFKSDELIESAFDIASYAKLKPQDRDNYERNLKYYRDLINSFESLKMDGRNEGIIEGKIKGEKQAKIEIAKKSILKGLNMNMISDLTGLNIEEIKKLQEELR